MSHRIFVFDPTLSDTQSKVRGIGRYLQILKENFPEWIYANQLLTSNFKLPTSILINPFFNLLQPPLIMRRIAAKQIAVIHDLIPLKYPKHFPIGIKGKLNVLLNKLALKNYYLIITDSDASKEDIVNILKLSEDKVRVIYPCLPLIFKLQTSNVKRLKLDAERFCLYVGDVTWNKNLVNLAKAIKIINVTCVFAGKVFETKNYKLSTMNYSHPWQKEFREFLQETKDDKRFVFEGFVDDYKLIKLYQQARVNILPSRDEGFGFSYLEAASQRCPSVLADIPVLHETSDEKAVFVSPHNPHEIANAIGEIYFDNEVRKSLGEKAHQRSKFFSPSQFKKTFLKTIQSL